MSKKEKVHLHNVILRWHHFIRSIFFPFPIITLIISIIFFSSPLGIPESFSICQAFLIENIFYFSIWHPSFLPPPFVFIVGLLFDLTNSLPMGLSAFLFLILQYISKNMRYSMIQTHFLFSWFVASSMGLLCAVIEWGAVCLLHLHVFDFSSLLFEGLTCLGLYPLIFALLSSIIGLNTTEGMS